MSELSINNSATVSKNQQFDAIKKPQTVQADPVTTQNTSDTQKLKQKEGLTTWQKWAIGVGTVGALGVAAYFICKGRPDKAKQVFKNIEFQPAKTLDEAINFGKKKFGIKEYVSFTNEDTEIVNYINEALANAHNATKGKIKMPDAIGIDSIRTSIAWYMPTEEAKKLGCEHVLCVTRNFFSNLDEKIKLSFKYINENALHRDITTDGTKKWIKELVEKWQRGEATFKEKIQLATLHRQFDNLDTKNLLKPDFLLQKFISKKGSIDVVLGSGEKISLKSIEDIKKLDIKTQAEVLEKCLKSGEFKMKYDKNNPFFPIFHEMGHIQHRAAVGAKMDNMHIVEDYTNIGKKVPEIVEDFIKDKRLIACQVSDYACASPAEFVADVYAKLLEGKTFPEEVMNLYKQYGGPMI